MGQAQLTTVALPHYELGRAAIEVLLDENPQQRSNGRPMISRVPMPLRERESVRQLAPSQTTRRAKALI